MRYLNRWARGKQWRIPFLALLGLAAVIASLLLYKAAFVDDGPFELVVLDLVLFFGGGFLVTWGTIAWQGERRKVYQRRADAQRRARSGRTRG
ncbi:MAG TPA: hypothetical protein VFN72_10765, partial [Solirubrobacterales bacterium]|nr:hypothetical protein [Solirubrobacterales bacterium]